MKNPLKTMAGLMKKFKRKRRLSSELHSRWGDPSISYPTQGSWNQRNQPSGYVANTSTGLPQSPHPNEIRRYAPTGLPQIPHPDDTRQYIPLESAQSRESNGSAPPYAPSDPSHDDLVIPKGYFDENIRHREKSLKPPTQGLGIAGTRHDRDRYSDHDVAVADESCDEDDEERDTLGDSGGAVAYRNYATGDASRLPLRDDYDSYPDRASKSPPLSVTSRMRRISTQSSMTEHSSIIGPASSRRTSYTAASSISAPSLPPDTPRYAVHAHIEKRVAPRPKYRVEPGPPTGTRQEMVPSYDDLYG